MLARKMLGVRHRVALVDLVELQRVRIVVASVVDDDRLHDGVLHLLPRLHLLHLPHRPRLLRLLRRLQRPIFEGPAHGAGELVVFTPHLRELTPYQLGSDARCNAVEAAVGCRV